MNKTFVIAGILAATVAAGGTAYAADIANTNQQGREGRGPGIGRGMERGGIEAQLLGITQEEFRTRIENGENPKDMLEAAGITREDIESAREESMRERLTQAVADGKLTQEEADAKIADMQAHQERHDAVRVALENNDYAAFQSAVAGTPLADEVTAENFSKFVEAHKLMESGDHEGAKTIMDELGIKGPKGDHGPEHGPGKGGPRGEHSNGPVPTNQTAQ